MLCVNRGHLNATAIGNDKDFIHLLLSFLLLISVFYSMKLESQKKKIVEKYFSFGTGFALHDLVRYLHCLPFWQILPASAILAG